MSNKETNATKYFFPPLPEGSALRKAFEEFVTERENYLKTEEGQKEQKTWMTLMYREYGPKLVVNEEG